MFGLIGEKLGMTQVFDKDGKFVPVTVVRVQPNLVTEVRTKEKHGYASVQLGYGNKKPKNIKKPQSGFFKKNNLRPVGLLKEFRTEAAAGFKVGTEIKVDALQTGDVVNVQSVSKGRGFQGVMKRWNFGGGHDSHGCSISHRVPGSIGNRAYPGRVYPDKKMPGHMGHEKVTVKNLCVVGIEVEQNLALVSGAIPGPQGSLLYIYHQSKDFEKRVLGEPKKEEKAEQAA